MFKYWISLSELNINDIDTINVIDMNNLFSGCINLFSINIEN